MLETDSPFMKPEDKHVENIGLKGKRNEPCSMPGVCRAIAEVYGKSPEEVAGITTKNAIRFFGLEGDVG